MDTTNDIVLISSDKILQERSEITNHLTTFTKEDQTVEGTVLFYHLTSKATIDEVESALYEANASHIILIADQEELSAWAPSLFLLPADGIVELGSLPEELPHVLESLKEGYFHLDASLHDDLIASLSQLQDTRRRIERFRINPIKCNGLNQTEQDVLERLANGQSTSTIARDRNCSIATVYLASTRLVKFFDVKDRTDAVVTAIRTDHLISEKRQ
ncbi:helix-turn-helix transcriptional regulator [Salisediminibacterium beveridgei]|uniref:LuxR Family Transcriptional Regulator n=1 Tax=Salisediminibacterium beveridgei TaxID=632773 RepID=A0A1D7QS67_9BACI|nr:LuxR C-terminal-related transcriptional regulator [Salisediminibacterium beveridgei]AOM81833.1 LuxR Family Transcriptional Regulator [Salisediminibacterium beveridgei]